MTQRGVRRRWLADRLVADWLINLTTPFLLGCLGVGCEFGNTRVGTAGDLTRLRHHAAIALSGDGLKGLWKKVESRIGVMSGRRVKKAKRVRFVRARVKRRQDERTCDVLLSLGRCLEELDAVSVG